MKGVATKRMEELLSPEKLKLIVGTFRMIKTFQDDMRDFPLGGRVEDPLALPMNERILRRFPDSAKKELRSIWKALNKLEKTGYLKSSAVDYVKDYIIEDAQLSDPLWEAIMKRELTESNRPNDNALDILVLSLVSHVKALSEGSPRYSLVAAFLCELSGENDEYSYDDVRSKHKRINRQSLERAYTKLKEFIDNRTLASDPHRRPLPSWETLLSPDK
jgi:hypothetical protein